MCHFRVDPKQCITLCDVILQGKGVQKFEQELIRR